MDARALRCLAIAAAAVTATLPVHAEVPPALCELPASDVDPLTDRAGILAQYERLPQPCLRAIFHACSTASSETLLDFGSAAVCSFGYEALLKQAFGGNFRALMAWWHTQRAPAVQ
jgi:hypothetical protein